MWRSRAIRDGETDQRERDSRWREKREQSGGGGRESRAAASWRSALARSRPGGRVGVALSPAASGSRTRRARRARVTGRGRKRTELFRPRRVHRPAIYSRDEAVAVEIFWAAMAEEGGGGQISRRSFFTCSDVVAAGCREGSEGRTGGSCTLIFSSVGMRWGLEAARNDA